MTCSPEILPLQFDLVALTWFSSPCLNRLVAEQIGEEEISFTEAEVKGSYFRAKFRSTSFRDPASSRSILLFAGPQEPHTALPVAAHTVLRAQGLSSCTSEPTSSCRTSLGTAINHREVVQCAFTVRQCQLDRPQKHSSKRKELPQSCMDALSPK